MCAIRLLLHLYVHSRNVLRASLDVQVHFFDRGGMSSGLLLLNCLPGERGNLESNECSGEARPPTTFRIYSRRTRRY